MSGPVLIIGLIADTHGLLRPEAVAALAGSAHIVHAGDVGRPEVLDGLRALAPVTAIRGNVDGWAAALPDDAAIEFGGRWVYVLHDVHALDLDPGAAGFDVVVAGHSHRPACERRGGVLFVNPGSAGPRRFSLPVSVGRLRIGPGTLEAELVELDVAPPRRRPTSPAA